MQFQVPQFIEVEDKIAGPLTLKQVLYLVFAGGVSLLSYFVFNFFFWILITALLVAIALVFGFAKYNGQPISKIFLASVGFLWKPRFYLWKRESEEVTIKIPKLPQLKNAPAKIIPTEKVLAQRESLGSLFNPAPAIKKLWDDLMTTKNPLPKREKVVPKPRTAERVSFFRKTSGEKEAARRVDFR
ncbi:MAG: PrgI family protein [Patescibacteria group bacterium]|nr:PrgI family protein [Patescibacteria group bacterium]